MTTAIGFVAGDGAVVAADRSLVRGDRIESRDRQRVYGFDDWGIAIAGDGAGARSTGSPPSGDDVDAIRDRVEAAVREYETNRGEAPGVEPLAHVAGEIAAEFGTSLLIVGRDEDGDAAVVEIHADGSRLEDSPVAIGSGADLALGRLEGADTDVAIDAAADLASDVIEGIAERDPETGEEADVWTLADA